MILRIAALLSITTWGPPVSAREVLATVYHPAFDGGTTACGGTYRHWGVSAAHPWLSCGHRLRITHNGRTLSVPVTDRCDCSSIDLSAGAAHRLGVPLNGTAIVTVN